MVAHFFSRIPHWSFQCFLSKGASLTTGFLLCRYPSNQLPHSLMNLVAWFLAWGDLTLKIKKKIQLNMNFLHRCSQGSHKVELEVGKLIASV